MMFIARQYAPPETYCPTSLISGSSTEPDCMLLCVSAVFKGVLSLLGVAPPLAPFLHRRPAASPMLVGGDQVSPRGPGRLTSWHCSFVTPSSSSFSMVATLTQIVILNNYLKLQLIISLASWQSITLNLQSNQYIYLSSLKIKKCSMKKTLVFLYKKRKNSPHTYKTTPVRKIETMLNTIKKTRGRMNFRAFICHHLPASFYTLYTYLLLLK